MSVCKFLAADIPLQEVKPSRDYPVHIDIDKGKYSFADIADYLMHGREIEFVYKDRECAITNHTKRWWLYDGVEQIEVCEFENFTLLVNKIAECIVDDKTVREIFEHGLYENVCIL